MKDMFEHLKLGYMAFEIGTSRLPSVIPSWALSHGCFLLPLTETLERLKSGGIDAVDTAVGLVRLISNTLEASDYELSASEKQALGLVAERATTVFGAVTAQLV